MQAGGYSLHLYCDRKSTDHRYDEFPHEFFAELGTTCRKEARQLGWVIGTAGKEDICPKCSKRKP